MRGCRRHCRIAIGFDDALPLWRRGFVSQTSHPLDVVARARRCGGGHRRLARSGGAQRRLRQHPRVVERHDGYPRHPVASDRQGNRVDRGAFIRHVWRRAGAAAHHGRRAWFAGSSFPAVRRYRVLGVAGHGRNPWRHDARAVDGHDVRLRTHRQRACSAAAVRGLACGIPGDSAADAPLDPDRTHCAARAAPHPRIHRRSRSRSCVWARSWPNRSTPCPPR